MHLFRPHIQRFQQSTLANTVNLLGLAAGLTAFLFISEFVAFEWGKNRHFDAAERTYRVYFTDPEQEPSPYIAPALAPAAREEVAGVEAATRFAPGLANGVVRVVEAAGQVSRQSYLLENEAFVDGAFLDIFNQPLLAGSADLSRPLTLALSRTEAERFFGSPEEAVGRQVQLSNQFGELRYQVVGVYEDYGP